MNRLRRPLTITCLAVATTLLLTATPPPVDAGIRDRIKSVKDKATGQPAAAPTFDDRTLELTGARLDQLLQAFQASAAITAERPKLVARQEQLQQEVRTLQERHGAAIGEYIEKRDAQRSCLSEAVDEHRRKRFDELMARGQLDPKSLEAVARLSVKLNEAQIRGDTAAVRKLGAEAAVMMGPSKEDTLAARKQCGPPPPPLPAALRLDAASAEQGALYERLRAMDLDATRARSKASGLTEDQLAIAIDRIILYLAAMKRRQAPSGFSETESQALADRRDALAAALGV